MACSSKQGLVLMHARCFGRRLLHVRGAAAGRCSTLCRKHNHGKQKHGSLQRRQMHGSLRRQSQTESARAQQAALITLIEVGSVQGAYSSSSRQPPVSRWALWCAYSSSSR
jgi:hypothetical protein